MKQVQSEALSMVDQKESILHCLRLGHPGAHTVPVEYRCQRFVSQILADLETIESLQESNVLNLDWAAQVFCESSPGVEDRLAAVATNIQDTATILRQLKARELPDDVDEVVCAAEVLQEKQQQAWVNLLSRTPPRFQAALQTLKRQPIKKTIDCDLSITKKKSRALSNISNGNLVK